MSKINIMKCELLGVVVNPASTEELNEILYYHIYRKRKCVIGQHNLHSVYLYHRFPEMKKFYDTADYVYIDGMPIVWFAKLLGYPVKIRHRATFIDWIYSLLKLATDNNWKLFYLGAEEGIAQIGIDQFKKKFPGLKMEAAHGYFDATPGSFENEEIVNIINTFRPDILMVGMGSPREESWILDNFKEIDATVFLTCGAGIDYFAGVKPMPPRWLGKIGLEGIFRLLSEPRRLWKRYLLEPWFVFKLFLRDFCIYKLGVKKR